MEINWFYISPHLPLPISDSRSQLLLEIKKEIETLGKIRKNRENGEKLEIYENLKKIFQYDGNGNFKI